MWPGSESGCRPCGGVGGEVRAVGEIGDEGLIAECGPGILNLGGPAYRPGRESLALGNVDAAVDVSVSESVSR